MGHTRVKTKGLAVKLKQIRLILKLSQNGLIKFLNLEKVEREDISKFERGVREPPLYVVLSYARSIGISTDVLIDDELDLPSSIDIPMSSPATENYAGSPESVKK